MFKYTDNNTCFHMILWYSPCEFEVLQLEAAVRGISQHSIVVKKSDHSFISRGVYLQQALV